MPLSLAVWTDRSSLVPDRPSRISLAIELVAHGTARESVARPARTVLALDVSGSMKGEPIAHVVRSVDRILDALGALDGREVGVVAFSDEATRVVEPLPVDAAGKRLIRARVSRLFAEGGTNLEGGLDVAAAMLATTPASWRRGVVLLSDGAPTVGAHTAELLRDVVRRHRPEVSFFALGYGADHAEDVLSAIGDAGGGGYEIVPDPRTCARAFARALGTQGDAVASGVELVIAPAEGVELVRFVGKEETRFSREGVIVALPDVIDGGRRLVAVELSVRVPGKDRFLADVVQVTARCSAPPSSVTRAASLEVADREPAVVPDALRRLFVARADEAREAARLLADGGNFTGAARALRTLMGEIERSPGWVANDGSVLAEAYELLVDEATTFERRPSLEAYAAFRKAAVSSKLAVNVPGAARSRGDASQKLIEHVAGDRPEAWLVELATGVRHELREETVIGRTNEADVRIERGDVARRHAEIYADTGAYWIVDLGSLAATRVNGTILGRAPHPLSVGDVVKVGDVELRYEERREEKQEGGKTARI